MCHVIGLNQKRYSEGRKNIRGCRDLLRSIVHTMEGRKQPLFIVISRGVLPYMGYIGICGPKGYGFSAVLVINRVSNLADFGNFGHK